jgi:hypothetical protein
MHGAAHKGREDPERLSFTHYVQVIRRQLTISGSFFPSGTSDLPKASSNLTEALQKRVVSSRGRHQARGVKRKMPSYALRPRATSKVASQMRKITVLK